MFPGYLAPVYTPLPDFIINFLNSARAERSYSTFKVRRGGPEKLPLVQGKEQQLHFTAAAVKRYPMSQVRETQVRR